MKKIIKLISPNGMFSFYILSGVIWSLAMPRFRWDIYMLCMILAEVCYAGQKIVKIEKKLK